jgi:hypothetical protein
MERIERDLEHQLEENLSAWSDREREREKVFLRQLMKNLPNMMMMMILIETHSFTLPNLFTSLLLVLLEINHVMMMMIKYFSQKLKTCVNAAAVVDI